jgi:myo-inositol 2-dehydrogenase / D-chiro-inositol 1-dehydrogenase
MSTRNTISRRGFLAAGAATAAVATIVPRHVLGGARKAAPSNTLTYAVIGNGKRRDAGIGCLGASKKIAVCDVDTGPEHLGGEPDNNTRYMDFRKLLERKDLDAVCIATPPHWHALVSIHAAQAGKHVFCEKPMTKFIAEGRGVVEACKKNKVVFQIGTFTRFGNSKNKAIVENHKIFQHGLLKSADGIVALSHAQNRTGNPALREEQVPSVLNYDMWLGPAPWKPYNVKRVHYQNRFYWDYEGGDLTNFGAHSIDPNFWDFAKDDTGPVKIVPHAPWPQHPECIGKYNWVELTFADGLRIIVHPDKGPAGYEGLTNKTMASAADLDEEGKKKLAALPDPEPLLSFGEAIRAGGGKLAGGGAESSHRGTTALHLCNIAIRMGRTIHWDPVKEQIVGDEQANRLVNVPMRAPWHL